MKDNEKKEGGIKTKIRPSRLLLGGILVLFLAAGILIRVVSGGFHARDQEKLHDLEYTVVEPDEVPESLASQIRLQREKPFHFTWQDGEDLYLVEGYGVQDSGGYSIQVKECYLTTDTIYINTELTGPLKGENVREAESYPVIVVKMPARQQDVVFK